jgi:tetratricopeptide (TPR) repeat protein
LPGCAVALAFILSCAHALKEPPPLALLGTPQSRPSSSADVETLLQQGEILYAKRSLAAAQDASGVYLQAAQADPTRIEGLVGAVKSQIWIIDHEPDRGKRASAAVLAVQAAQWCRRIAPTSPVCDYWLGAALGVQARERSSTALDALPRIEELFQRAAEADPELEEGGPSRALALLYARAPGWPTGPGDPERALAEARKAVALKPDYPPNQLALGEALDLNGDSRGARDAYSRALDLAKGREAAGDPDAAEWIQEAERSLHSKPPISP